MQVVILAGGFGTRLSEYTETIPKPMVKIGGKPMLWHIMKIYAKFGYKDFNIALGYKAEVIKEYQKRRQGYYESLSTFETFGRGWTRRTTETTEAALNMI